MKEPRLSYEERSDIEEVIGAWFYWLSDVLALMTAVSSVNIFDEVWERVRNSHTQAIAGVDSQLARSCGVEMCLLLALPYSERMARLLEHHPGSVL